MIAISQPAQRSPQIQDNELFLQLLPTIQDLACFAFRHLPRYEREEAISAVICDAYCAFRRLAELGKQQLAFATPLARFSIARFRTGRCVGNKLNSRDIASSAAQRRRGFCLESLESGDCGPSVWLEILADNRLTPVPDQVAFRLDFSAWLSVQKHRHRELARFLALGNKPSEAAQRFGVTQARISQVRRELQTSWQAFQGEST
jgi:hypothetical protein